MYTNERISDFARVIPRELLRTHELRSWLGFLRCLLMAVLFQGLLYLMPPWGSLWGLLCLPILIFLAGLSIVGLFVVGHDCGHYAFSKYHWVNDLVGFVCFLPMLSSFFAWRVAHDFHHRHNQTRRVDPDWAELLVTPEEFAALPWHQRLAVRLGLGSPLGILLGFWVGMVKRSFFSIFIPQMRIEQGKRRRLYALNALSFGASMALLWFYANIVGQEKFFVMFVLPALVATTTGAFLTFLHHSHPGSYAFDPEGFDVVRSQVDSTFNVRFPRFLEFLWLDINIHVPHHLVPVIPWYHLRGANEVLKKSFGPRINETIFTGRTLGNSWRAYKIVRSSGGTYKLA